MSGDVVVKLKVDSDADKLIEFGKASEVMATQVKASGQKFKGGAELFGSLANFAGSSQLGGFAGQLGQLTEKIGQFSEVAKAGGAGALVFKAGLAGASALIGFEIGKSIGDAIFQTKKWTEELEKATSAMGKLNERAKTLIDRGVDFDLQEINLLGDPDKQLEETTKLLNAIEQKIADKQRAIEDRVRDARSNMSIQWFSGPEGVKQAEDTSDLKADIEALERNREKLQELTNERQRSIDAQKKDIEEKKKLAAIEAQLAAQSDKYIEGLRDQLALLAATKEEQIALTAAKNADAGDRSTAEALLMQIESKKVQQKLAEEIEQSKQKALAREQAAAERLHELYKSQADELTRQVIAVTKGTEAANAEALVQQGLDASFAKKIAHAQALREEIDKDRFFRVEREVNITGGRFVNSVRGNDPTQPIKENTGIQRQVLAYVKEMVELERQARTDPKLKVVL